MQKPFSNGKQPQIIQNYRIFKDIYGNAVKKDLDFRKVVEQNFGEEKLADLLCLLHSEKITVANAKVVMRKIIDGDSETPTVIADKLGLTGDAMTDEVMDDKIIEVLEEKKKIVDKIIKTGKTGPLMSLVGSVMQKLNKRGDPKLIQRKLTDHIEKMKK